MIRTELVRYRGERTQKEMALLYKVTQQCWALWENGASTPKLQTMMKIAAAIGKSPEKIFPEAFGVDPMTTGFATEDDLPNFDGFFEGDK